MVRNPADLATPPKVSKSKSADLVTWSADELRAFLEHVRDDRHYALYHLTATTGLRRGEVAGLTWRSLDLDAGRLSVNQTLISVDYRVLTSTPKARSGRRSVALDPETVRVLREHRKVQLEERLALGGYEQVHDLVFCELDGQPLHPANLSQRFRRLVRSTDLRPLRFHDLRHTHATLALQAGVHPKVVSERLGHVDIGITLNLYSHVIPAMEEEAAATVAALLSG